MARETIYTLMRPGFPKESLDENSYRNTIEYVGKYSDIQAANCRVGIQWGDYPGRVQSAVAEPIEGTDRAILTVIVERKFEQADYPGSNTGTKTETNEEIDWVDVQRSLYEHPAFQVGGGGAYELTNEDVAAIKAWEKNPNPEYKKIYTYSKDGYKTGVSASSPTLTTNAKMFARGLESGLEYWVDKAPVVRLSEIYSGGPPPEGSAGQKEDPTGILGDIPAGYEWIRTADRGVRTGGQTKWKRSIEWVGAKKVLIDKDEVFWNAPQ